MECASSGNDLHRVGLEARGGQVVAVAYYNKWRLRTCSLEWTRETPASKWRLTAEGATRVQTPDGTIVIITRANSYELAFQNVARRAICGTPGQINGTIVVERGAGKRACEARGFEN